MSKRKRKRRKKRRRRTATTCRRMKLMTMNTQTLTTKKSIWRWMRCTRRMACLLASRRLRLCTLRRPKQHQHPDCLHSHQLVRRLHVRCPLVRPCHTHGTAHQHIPKPLTTTRRLTLTKLQIHLQIRAGHSCAERQQLLPPSRPYPEPRPSTLPRQVPQDTVQKPVPPEKACRDAVWQQRQSLLPSQRHLLRERHLPSQHCLPSACHLPSQRRQRIF